MLYLRKMHKNPETKSEKKIKENSLLSQCECVEKPP